LGKGAVGGSLGVFRNPVGGGDDLLDASRVRGERWSVRAHVEHRRLSNPVGLEFALQVERILVRVDGAHQVEERGVQLVLDATVHLQAGSGNLVGSVQNVLDEGGDRGVVLTHPRRGSSPR
jgi:hypothetical protein